MVFTILPEREIQELRNYATLWSGRDSKLFIKGGSRLYASLYFCICNDEEDNELETLAIIHHFVETLDRYFGSVCELDLIFNFHKAYFILDEILIAGAMQETSKRTTLRLIAAQEDLVEVAKMEASSLSNIIAQATK
ncbi:AP-1 complex subunit sigma 1/2 [Vigna unguiculata]|uniref:AP-1 complex subunit sigma 1/2 n=1 Tax=Vigna unguiculata TaxID=3917 RepID=A0A4D6MKJ0_VIGUN|nr:AP-1 complex subunit sigma 1/2 [Vigna unguiculata]